MNDNHIKLKVQLDKVFFPKSGIIIAGEWSSFSCKVNEVTEGEVHCDKKYKTIKCRGKNVPSMEYEEEYILICKETYDKKYGYQYEVVTMGTNYDLTKFEDQKKFLSYILTNQQIDSLYSAMENPFKAIKEEDTSLLTSVRGIGLARALAIINKFKENEGNGEVYVELDSYGLTKEAMDKLISIFGTLGIIGIIKENPYQLIDLVKGYGWKKVDAMALTNGMLRTDIRRIIAYIKYFMQDRENQGHSYAFPAHLLDSILETLGEDLPISSIKEAMNILYEKKVIWWDETKEKIFLLKTVILEKKITEELTRINSIENSIKHRELEEILSTIEEKNGWEFTDEQKNAVTDTLKSNVSIITGFGGTGKSTVVSAILQCCIDTTFAQTALAGRAAARLGEITGEDGYTIHRLLGIKEGKFIHNQYNPLPYDLIILDEISMVGGHIFYSLIKAIKNGAKLIMLGDVGQLEAIGVLNLFRDLIDSSAINVSHLTKIHRQAQKSAIITTSMSIRNQEKLFDKKYLGKEVRGELQDLELDIYEESALSQRVIVRHYQELIKKGIDPNDIQVIVPMKTRGDISTFALNPILKAIANPTKGSSIEKRKFIGDVPQTYTLSVGDRVINTSNDYTTFSKDGITTPIFNGNMGIIKSIEKSSMIIDFFQWGEIIIVPKKYSEIELAYAITCHKLQGSQSPYVIIGVDNSAYMMLTKEWLYTAVTRAEKYCILCGENSAIQTCIRTSRVPEKQTMLTSFLNGVYPLENIPNLKEEEEEENFPVMYDD